MTNPLKSFETDLNDVKEKDVVRLVKKYKKRLENYIIPKTGENYKDNTLIYKLSLINGMVKKKYPKLYDEIVKFNIPNKEMKKKQIYDRKIIVYRNKKDRIKFDYSNILSIVEQLKKSENYYELLSVLIICSGRRNTEIAYRGKFIKTSKNKLLFSGQLKKRSEEDIPYEIPILFISVDDFIILLNKSRKMRDFDGKTNSEISKQTNAGVNRIIKKHFGEGITSETLRSVYAYISYRLYGSDRISEDLYGATILGHNILDTETFSNHYSTIYVENIPKK